MNARLSRLRVDHHVVVVTLPANAIVGTRHDHDMDRFEPGATALQIRRGQEPQEVESNGGDLEIIEGEQDVMRVWKRDSERTAQTSGRSRHRAQSPAREKVDS